jgi:hypothetical protein
LLCVVSEAYLKKPYSSLERQAGQWAAVTTRPNFLLPVFIEPCEAPTLFALLKRCDLPRTRGDEPRAASPSSASLARSPHARGRAVSPAWKAIRSCSCRCRLRPARLRSTATAATAPIPKPRSRGSHALCLPHGVAKPRRIRSVGPVRSVPRRTPRRWGPQAALSRAPTIRGLRGPPDDGNGPSAPPTAPIGLSAPRSALTTVYVFRAFLRLPGHRPGSPLFLSPGRSG